MLVLRDNSARAKQILAIFWIMLGITVADMASLGWQYYLLNDVQANPGNIDMEVLRASDTLRQIITIVNLLIVLLAIVFFIMWFRRAYYNIHTLPWHNARYTEGWAAGSWFVPVVNLWWPYQIMVDIWRATQNALRERLGEPQSTAIIGWWWGLRLLDAIFGNISTRVTAGAKGIDELMTATQLEFVADIITIPAIIVTIILITRTSSFEKELLVHSETPSDSIFSENYVVPQEDVEYKIERAEQKNETGTTESKTEI